MGKSFMKKRDGFTLIIVLLGLALMSILGIAIMGTTASNAKMTKVDGQSQGTYYIAEAGLNKAVYDMKEKVNELSQEQKTHDGFFDALDEYRDPAIPYGFEEILIGFENNFAETPKAEISISSGLVVKEEVKEGVIGEYSERVVRYDITSKGEIGKSNRSVTRSVDISHKIELNTGHHAAFDYALYSGGDSTFNHPGGATVRGSVYGKNLKFEATGSDIEGNIVSEKSVDLVSALKLTGNVYAMDGKVNLSNSNLKVTGNIHAKDSVMVSSGSSLEGNIYTLEGGVNLSGSNVKMIGNIHAKDSVTLSSGSSLEGNIYTNEDVVLVSSNAKVTHDIHAGGNVTLESSSFIGGNLYTSKAVVFKSSGAEVRGNINAGGNVGINTDGNAVKVYGDIISGGNVITNANQSYEFFKNVYAAGKITNGAGNKIIGDVVSAKTIINYGTIGGAKIENATPGIPQAPLPVKPPEFEQYKQVESVPLSDITIGDDAQNIVKTTNSFEHVILPGIHKNLVLQWNDTVMLTAGNYYFNSIKGNESAIKLKLDISNGPINIYSVGDIEFGSGLIVYVSEDGSNYRKIQDILNEDLELAIKLAGKIYWETHTKLILPSSNNCHFIGSILAKDNFTTGSYAKLIGAYAVKEGNISMGYGPKVIYAPPTDSAAGGSGGSGDSAKGKNVKDEKDRVEATKIIEQ